MNGNDKGAAVFGAARLPLVGLLLIQLFLGYEWLMSGLTKIVRGGFASGLADELAEKSEGVGGSYGSALDEGVDLDSLMPALQLVLIGMSVGALRAVRRERPAASPATGDPATD